MLICDPVAYQKEQLDKKARSLYCRNLANQRTVQHALCALLNSSVVGSFKYVTFSTTSPLPFPRSSLGQNSAHPRSPTALPLNVCTRVFETDLGFPALADVAFFREVMKFYNFLVGSFSAVSKRNFARKYAFDSIFQALQDVHTFAPLQSQIFCKKLV